MSLVYQSKKITFYDKFHTLREIVSGRGVSVRRKQLKTGQRAEEEANEYP